MKKITFLTLLFLGLSITGHAEDIEDNSFLVEEAYNQEPGVVQFIFTYQGFKKVRILTLA